MNEDEIFEEFVENFLEEDEVDVYDLGVDIHIDKDWDNDYE